jgi:hypothetical protein
MITKQESEYYNHQHLALVKDVLSGISVAVPPNYYFGETLYKGSQLISLFSIVITIILRVLNPSISLLCLRERSS